MISGKMRSFANLDCGPRVAVLARNKREAPLGKRESQGAHMTLREITTRKFPCAGDRIVLRKGLVTFCAWRFPTCKHGEECETIAATTAAKNDALRMSPGSLAVVIRPTELLAPPLDPAEVVLDVPTSALATELPLQPFKAKDVPHGPALPEDEAAADAKLHEVGLSRTTRCPRQANPNIPIMC